MFNRTENTKMKFFSLPNLSSDKILDDGDPRNAGPTPEFEDKAGYREWCNNKSTNWIFFSHVEGMSSRGRITVQNEPYMLHGFTADYDSEQTHQEALPIILKNMPEGLGPSWISSSFSGHLRLTWEFEEPVFIDQPQLAERFLKQLEKTLKIDKLCAGLDESTFKLSQYWAAGSDWARIQGGRAIPSRELSLMMLNAAKSVQIKTEGPTIPIEQVAVEVERRWPGRCDSFAEGVRVPLFWVEPFEDRVGAQVGEFGMICYSTRAGKSFVGWSEILGPEFMRDFQAKRIGAAAENLYFNGKHYFRKDEDGEWKVRTKEDTVMWLKGQGISARASAKKVASEAEEVLLAIQQTHEVAYAAPLVHDNRQIVVVHGDKILNTSRVPLMKPADTGETSEFPWLYSFFNNIWKEPTKTQRDFFLAWLQHAYKFCLAGRPAQGQAVIIAGPASSGKTFLTSHILGRIFGGASDATEFLMGRTNFNKQDSQVYLWAIDDSKGSISWENKAAFSAALKKHVANPTVRCEAKGVDAVTLPYKGRIVVICNTDRESLNIIPSLNNTIKDKIMLFMWKGWNAKFLPNGGTEEIVAQELPHFLRWLIDWKPPQEVLNDDPRFMINVYHHPDMLDRADSMTPHARLREILATWIAESGEVEEARKNRARIWKGAYNLRRALSLDPGTKNELREFHRWHMDLALEELGFPSRKRGGVTEYLLFDGCPEKERPRTEKENETTETEVEPLADEVV